MKSFTPKLFLITSILYSLAFLFQTIQMLSLFRPEQAPQGPGLAFQIPNHLPGVLAIVALNVVAFLVSVYLGMVGIRLTKRDTRGLKTASIAAFLLPPLGLITGLFGLAYARSLKKNAMAAGAVASRR